MIIIYLHQLWLIHRIFSKEEADRICAMNVGGPGKHDKAFAWFPTKDGVFTGKSGYCLRGSWSTTLQLRTTRVKRAVLRGSIWTRTGLYGDSLFLIRWKSSSGGGCSRNLTLLLMAFWRDIVSSKVCFVCTWGGVCHACSVDMSECKEGLENFVSFWCFLRVWFLLLDRSSPVYMG